MAAVASMAVLPAPSVPSSPHASEPPQQSAQIGPSPMENAIAASWHALEQQRAQRLAVLKQQARPSTMLNWSLAPSKPLELPKLRASATAAANDNLELVQAINALRESIQDKPPSREVAAMGQVASAQAVVTAEAAVHQAHAEAASARELCAKLEAELIVERRSSEAAKAEVSKLRDAIAAADDELTVSDVHTAQITNELRLVHAAAAAAAAERAELQRRIQQRTSEVLDVTEAALRYNTTSSEDHAAAEYTALVARRSVDEAARRGSSGAHAAVGAMRDAYSRLHRHASTRLEALSRALVAAAERELQLRSDVVETGTLLLKTHVALGTAAGGAPRLTAIEARLARLAFEPPPAPPQLEPLEHLEPGVTVSTPALIAPDAPPPAALPLTGSNATGVPAEAGHPKSMAPAGWADGSRAVPDEGAFLRDGSRAAGQQGSRAAAGQQDEGAFLRDLDASLAARTLIGERAAAAIAMHDALITSGGSVLLRAREEDDGYMTGMAVGMDYSAGSAVGESRAYATSDGERARRARARMERTMRRTEAAAREAAVVEMASSRRDVESARSQIEAEAALQERVASVRAEITAERADELSALHGQLAEASAMSTRHTAELARANADVERLQMLRQTDESRHAAAATAAVERDAVHAAEAQRARADVVRLQGELDARTSELRTASERASHDRSDARGGVVAPMRDGGTRAVTSPARVDDAEVNARLARATEAAAAADAAKVEAEARAVAAELRAVTAEAATAQAESAAADAAKAAEAKAAEARALSEEKARQEAKAGSEMAAVLAVRAQARALEAEDCGFAEQLGASMADGATITAGLRRANDALREAHVAAAAEFSEARANTDATGLANARRVEEVSKELSAYKHNASAAASAAARESSGLVAKVEALQTELREAYAKGEKEHTAHVRRVQAEKNDALVRERRATAAAIERAEAAEERAARAEAGGGGGSGVSGAPSAVGGVASAEATTMRSELEESRQAMEAAQRARDALQARLDACEKECDAAKRSLADGVASRQELSARVRDLEKRLQEATQSSAANRSAGPSRSASSAACSLSRSDSKGSPMSMGSRMSAGSRARLLADVAGDGSGELSLSRGEEVTLLQVDEHIHQGWRRAAHKGTTGYLPETFLEEIASPPQLPDAASGAAPSSPRPSLLPPPPPPPPLPAAPLKGGFGYVSSPNRRATLADDPASPASLEDVEELTLEQSPPQPPREAAAAPSTAAAALLAPISAVAAAQSPAEKLPSPHARGDDFYRQRALEIKAQRDKAAAEQQAAERARVLASDSGLGHDDGFSVGSASDDELELPGF